MREKPEKKVYVGKDKRRPPQLRSSNLEVQNVDDQTPTAARSEQQSQDQSSDALVTTTEKRRRRIRSRIDRRRIKERHAEKKRDWQWIGIAIGVLTLIVIGLQWHSMEKAIEQSEITRKVENRAYVGIVQVASNFPFMMEDQPVHVSVLATNTGKTPALYFQTQIYSDWNPDTEVPEGPRPFEKTGLPDKGIIMPGVTTELPINIPVQNYKRALNVIEPNMRFYVWGTIDYDDVFGDHHQTTFEYMNGASNSREWWACNTGNSFK